MKVSELVQKLRQSFSTRIVARPYDSAELIACFEASNRTIDLVLAEADRIIQAQEEVEEAKVADNYYEILYESELSALKRKLEITESVLQQAQKDFEKQLKEREIAAFKAAREKSESEETPHGEMYGWDYKYTTYEDYIKEKENE